MGQRRFGSSPHDDSRLRQEKEGNERRSEESSPKADMGRAMAVPQIPEYRLSTWVTVLGPHFKEASHDLSEPSGRFGSEIAYVWRPLEGSEAPPEVGDRLMGQSPREHLEKYEPCGVKIAFSPSLLPQGLLRREIIQGPHNPLCPSDLRLLPVKPPGKTEIGELCLTTTRKEDVSRLHVPMNDSERMEGGESLEELDRDMDRLLDGERPLAQEVPEGESLDELHREVGALRRGADIENPHETGTRCIPCHLHLTAEASESTWPLPVRLEELQGNLPPHLSIKDAVGGGMPSAAQETAHLVPPTYGDSGRKAFFLPWELKSGYGLGAIRLKHDR